MNILTFDECLHYFTSSKKKTQLNAYDKNIRNISALKNLSIPSF